MKWFSSLPRYAPVVSGPSLPRSAWECIPTFVKAHSLLHVFELGMHSHAERGNEKKSLVACAVRTYSLDVHGCTSVAEATDGLERPFGTAISMEMAVKRAHGARDGFGMWE